MSISRRTLNQPWVFVLASVLAVQLAGCGAEDGGSERTVDTEDVPVVYAVNYPLQYFAQRIAGDLVKVEFPAPQHVDPAFWTPEPAVIASFQEADLILLNGATYAKWVDKVSLPGSKLVTTSRSFEERFIHTSGTVTHSHGPGGEHAHGGVAFTTWLDLQLATEQAAAIQAAFAEAWPEHAEAFLAGYESLRSDLLALDRRLEMVAARNPDLPLFASHPVYQYLSRRYALNVSSVQWEPDEPPGEVAWTELRQTLRDHPAAWMLWEAEPVAETTALLREIGIEPVVFDQCSNVPAEGDFLTVMEQNAANLERVFWQRRE